MDGCEFLIVGAGIIGLTIAKTLLEKNVDNICLLEKEAAIGLHASGRNSGVLHAGIYYPPNTLKAQLCLKGNLLLQAYCQQKNLPLLKTGKVIVAKNAEEVPALNELYTRAKTNGAAVDLIDEQTLCEIEPNAKTVEKALYSHYTAAVDNKRILEALLDDLLQSKKVKILFNSQLKNIKQDFIAVHSQGEMQFKYFINTAGAYADKVAHGFDIAKNYYFIPFKGIYKKLITEKNNLVNGNIYPVPNLGNPFLGVHFSKNIHGEVYVGPTAIPAFGRENYGVLQGIDKEILRIVWNELFLYCTNKAFRQIAHTEPKKYLNQVFYQDAKKLVKELQPGWLTKAHKVGIRPQLINLQDKQLLMDFLVIKEKHSIHVLNAISPAFTSSLAFAKYVVETYLGPELA